MDIKKTLAQLDSILGSTPTSMTKAQFEAYAAGQMTKAKAEAEEGDEGKEKAKKRLAHLRGQLNVLAKAEEGSGMGPFGDNGTALIQEYDYGFEDTTRKTEISETEQKTPPAGNQGTQGDGSAAFSNAEPSYAQQAQSFTASGTQVPASGSGTQGNNSAFEQGDAVIGKTLENIGKMLVGVTPTTPKQKVAPAPTAPKYDWPRDLADPAYVKDGIAKRAPDHWGGDRENTQK